MENHGIGKFSNYEDAIRFFNRMFNSGYNVRLSEDRLTVLFWQ